MIRAGIRRAFRLPLGGRQRWEREVEEEIKLHLALRAEQLMREGLSADRAYDEAIRRFGPVSESHARLLETARHREARMQRAEYLSDLRQDLSFALRTLGRQKSWTTIALLTFALGIGATTAVFSAVSSLLLHPLPFPGSNRLVFVDQQPAEGNKSGISVSILPTAPIVRTWLERAHSFETLEGYLVSDFDLATRSGTPSTVTGARVFPTYLRFARQHTLIGRMFDSAEVANNAHVVVIGEGLWTSRFGADEHVLGKAITLDDSLYTVVGVAPASLHSPQVAGTAVDVWLPMNVYDDARGMRLLGQLRSGVSAATAARELDSVWAQTRSGTAGPLAFAARVLTPAQTVRFRDSLVILTAAATLVLLVACANVAHLLMARGATRQQELAVRVALGAGRGRLLRQLLAESLVLTATGSVLGIGVGWAGLHALLRLRPTRLTELSAAHLDWVALASAIGMALVCGLVFGGMAAVQSARTPTSERLKSSTGASLGRSRVRGRGVLVISEMALSATLVVGATMLVRSVSNLQNADVGFEPRGLYHLEVSLPASRFHDATQRAAFVRELAQRLRGVQGISALSLVSTPPGWRSFSIGRFEVDGEPRKTSSATELVDINAIDDQYFKTMGMRLTQGRMFTDTSKAAGQVIINAGFARAHWPGNSAVGHRVRIATVGNEPWLTIVGVANEAQMSGPTSESTAPLLYSPAHSGDQQAIVLRTTDARILTHLRELVRSMDPRATTNVRSIEHMMSESIATPRFVMQLLAAFTLLALVLAAVGMYGVMAYTVTERTREIGIRVALGAPRERIARIVLARGTLLATAGALIGLVTARWGTKLIEHQLFGVARSDVTSFAAAAFVLVTVALLACVVPTRRALAVDPMTAIRAD